MARLADLYIRVSTDEQAEKGYSLRSQKDVLERYCDINGIRIRKIFTEDHSAKTFNRPQWKQLLTFLKRSKRESDLLLFTKWDRFSRNTSDAYQMIAFLRKVGIEPQAIEQPLNLDVPENKMILAVYLTTPEIENDRRGLSTKAGIRQAKKEGRWTGPAPLGYVNKTKEDGSKYICHKFPEAAIIKWIFDQLARNVFSGEQILIEAREKGLKCSKNNFYCVIKNPMYYGKVIVPRFKDEEEELVDGKHQALISEEQFHKVQEILAARGKVHGRQVSVPEQMPLRGFLMCPKCTRKLTGSAPGAKVTRIYYYHCHSKCGARIRANVLNAKFVEHIENFKLESKFVPLFSIALNDAYQNQLKDLLEEKKKLKAQIEGTQYRIQQSREMLLEGTLDSSDFRGIKLENTVKLEKLNTLLQELKNKNKIILDREFIIGHALGSVKNLNLLFAESDIEEKRLLISHLYPEGISYKYEKFSYRDFNKAGQIIFNSS
ncbi:recombinase family protein [Pedobacter suwonensis]|uniref:recombinase family protein n=1 Tax=Pedobacter suwonensis TaxID=332999 RepID=UPI0036C0C396